MTTTAPTLAPDFWPLCSLHELPDGGARGYDPLGSGQDSVVLVRRGERVQAWHDACPHHGTPMAWRRHAYLNAAGDRIVCSAHGALFDIDTGLCVQGPCLGDSLTALPVVTGADGRIGVRLAAESGRAAGMSVAPEAAPTIPVAGSAITARA